VSEEKRMVNKLHSAYQSNPAYQQKITQALNLLGNNEEIPPKLWQSIVKNTEAILPPKTDSEKTIRAFLEKIFHQSL
jgi:hypothetical protein